MIVLHNKAGAVVGLEDGNFSQRFSTDNVAGQVEVPEKLAQRFRDTSDSLHVSMCNVKGNKIILPKMIEEANSVDIGS